MFSSLGVCLAELRVEGIKGGFIKHRHDSCLRVIVQDLFLVDKLQEHHPQYELILSSNASSLFTESTNHQQSMDDIFKFDGEFFLNIVFNQYSCLSVDYPKPSATTDEPDIRKLLIQCTAITAIGTSMHLYNIVYF